MPPPPEHKWLWLLMSIYILFLLMTVYAVKENTKRAIDDSKKMIQELIAYKHSHIVETEMHDKFARDNLSLINTKLDILLSKADAYHHKSMEFLTESVLNGAKHEPKTKSK